MNDEVELEERLAGLAKDMAEARERCLEHVVAARQTLEEARHEYDTALLDADTVGLSYTEMARACGVSEAAIRLYIKRRKP